MQEAEKRETLRHEGFDEGKLEESPGSLVHGKRALLSARCVANLSWADATSSVS